jgi:fos-like antigen, invertebrate
MRSDNNNIFFHCMILCDLHMLTKFFSFIHYRLSGQEFDLCTPTPTTPYMPQLLTPTLTSKSQKPNRPSFLPVPANLKPSDLIAGKNVSEIAGVAVNTPSTGMFNFDSLMDGGTGLTPVTTLVPCSTQNRNPLDMLQTPTSESSKNLCSL